MAFADPAGQPYRAARCPECLVTYLTVVHPAAAANQSKPLVIPWPAVTRTGVR